MPAYPDRGHLKARIVARVADGETVEAICGEAGMPDAATVQAWRRGDPGFAAELAQARRRGDWRRRFAFDEAMAEAFFVRVRAGERIRDLLAKPGMPSQGTYRYWRRTQGAFAEELWRLRAVSYARRPRPRPYRPFDQAVADRMLVRVAKGEAWRRMLETDTSMPSRVVTYRWRFEEPLWDKALKIAFRVGRLTRERDRLRARCEGLSEEIGERIALRGGGSLRRVAWDPDMPCARTLYKWTALFPDFARTVADAYDFRDWMAADRALAASPFCEVMQREVAEKIAARSPGPSVRRR